MQEKFQELGEEVNVVMINIEGEDIDRTAGEFAKEHKLTLPHFAVDSMDDVEAYGVQFIPHHTVISVRIRSRSFCAPTAGADTLRAVGPAGRRRARIARRGRRLRGRQGQALDSGACVARARGCLSATRDDEPPASTRFRAWSVQAALTTRAGGL